MRPSRINAGRGLVKAIRMQMEQDGISRYSLAQTLAKELGATQINVDRRLARMFSDECKKVDLDFAIAAVRQLDLVLEVRNK